LAGKQNVVGRVSMSIIVTEPPRELPVSHVSFGAPNRRTKSRRNASVSSTASRTAYPPAGRSMR
jgi:hypothetical protein